MTKFKKGQIPWNKGNKMPELSGKNHPMFGKHHSEESIKKMSESKKGKMIGEKNPFWGKTHSKETRRKISEAHKGKPSPMKGKKTGKPAWNKGLFKETDERVLKCSLSNKGKSPSSESIRKMVETRMKNGSFKHTEEQKRKIGLASKGKKHSKESKQKMSIAQKKFMANPIVKERMRKIWTGRKHTEESKRKMSEAHKKSYLNPEFRKIHKEAMKKRYEDGEIPWNKGKKSLQVVWNKGKKMPELSEWGRKNILKMYESNSFPKQTDTKIEKSIKEELGKRGYKEGIDFIHQFKFMDKFMCDFCFPMQKLIVEAYGDFWHVNPKKYPKGSKLHPHQIKGKRRDRSKEAYITKVDNGTWTYIFLWESDIKENLAKCVDKIEVMLAKLK